MTGIRLTVVGCSGSYPGPESPASCYLLESSDGDRTWRILLDLGNGALGALHRYADPLAIDAVLLSHLHADHCLDLTSYYVLRRYHPRGPQPPLPVWGPEGTAERIARAYDLPAGEDLAAQFDVRTHADPVRIGPFTVTAIPVRHPVPAYGLRVEAGGATLGYSGDTAPCAGLDQVAADADLLLAEASFRSGDDNPEGLHLTGTEAGDAAARNGARALLLTHIPPWHDPAIALAEARAVYDGPVSLAAAGDVHELGGVS